MLVRATRIQFLVIEGVNELASHEASPPSTAGPIGCAARNLFTLRPRCVTVRSSMTRCGIFASGSAASALVAVLERRAEIGLLGLALTIAAIAAISDLQDRTISNSIIVTAILIAVFGAVVVRVVDHRQVACSMLLGALVTGCPLLLVHLARPSALGAGDVKLAVVLGGLLGSTHWILGTWMLLAACVVATAAITVIRSWRTSVPFGACMAAGSCLALLATQIDALIARGAFT